MKSVREVSRSGVYTAISVLSKRPPATCRVVVGSDVVRDVIKTERLGTHGGVIKGIHIEHKRGIAKSGVVVSGHVGEECKSAGGCVAVGIVVLKRSRSNGGVIAALAQ